MGRKKISISKIENKQQRNITFHKRKIGLLKKAYQLAQLCNIQIYMVFNDLQGNTIHFRTEEINQIEGNNKKKFLLTPKDYPKFVTRTKNAINIQSKDLAITPIKLVTDFIMPPDEALLSRYSAMSNHFFPPPLPLNINRKQVDNSNK